MPDYIAKTKKPLAEVDSALRALGFSPSELSDLAYERKGHIVGVSLGRYSSRGRGLVDADYFVIEEGAFEHNKKEQKQLRNKLRKALGQK